MEMEGWGSVKGYIPAHSIGFHLETGDIFTIHIPNDILHLVFQALWYVLTPPALSYWCWRDRESLLRGRMVGHVRKADFTVELQKTIRRAGDALS
jgi:hypothetical protein